jgi:hypothetical protein
LLGDLPPTDEPSACLLGDVLLGPVWALLALAGVVHTAPINLTRGEWLLFASFWSVVIAALALYFFGQ